MTPREESDPAASAIRSTIVRGAAGAFSASVGAVVLGLLLQVVLARLMGVSQFGVFVYVSGWIGVLVVLALLGTDTIVLRYVPAYQARGDWRRLRGVLSSGALVSLAGGLFVGGCATLAVWWLGTPEFAAYAVGFASLPLVAYLRQRQAALRAFGRVVLAIVPERVVRPALFVVAALAVGSAAGHAAGSLTALGGLVLSLIAVVAAVALAARFLRTVTPRDVRRAERRHEPREWAAAGAAMFITSAAMMVNSQADNLMLGALIDTDASGIYVPAAQVALLVAFGQVAVNAIMAPTISRLHAAGDGSGLQGAVTLAARYSLLLALPVAIGLLVAAPLVLRLFGDAFPAGADALRVLAVAQLLNTACGSVGFVVLMTGRERVAAVVAAASTVLNIALNAVLIPRYQLVGAALATGASLVFWNVALLGFCLTRLRVNPTILGGGGRA